MRGETEQQAFNRIINAVFFKDNQPMRNPFSGKSFLEATDDEFQKEQVFFINNECSKSFFGLTEEDRTELYHILRKAHPNPSPSEFPDFIFDGGFIEHFAITSSKTTRQGSTHTKKLNEFKRQVDQETKEIEEEWNEVPSFDEVRSKEWMHNNPQHSYEYLYDSFTKSWEHHCDSLKKYCGPKSIGVFLIEYPEIALAMHENVYVDWIDGMSHGDMRGQEKFRFYRLSRDKKLLNYIYEQRDIIKYVFFENTERFEIIKTENIPYLIKLMPWDFLIHPLCVTTVSSLYNTSVPNKGGEKDDQT